MDPHRPAPIPAGDAGLPGLPEDLIERLAERVHEVWAQARLHEGWTHGPRRDDVLKQHPGLVPYQDLPETERDYDRSTARETLRALLGMGFSISPPDRTETVALGTLRLGTVPGQPSPEAAFPIGKKGHLLGKYELLDLLGRGGLGEVWHARDTGITQREVALKTIRTQGEAFQTEALKDEARIMARMFHQPNLPVLYDVLEVSGGFALVVEYLPGYDLDRLIREAEGPIGWPDVRNLLAGLLAGLEHAHRYEVLHRDLKPRNVRIFNPTEAFRPIRVQDVKILDFGLGVLWKDWNASFADDWARLFSTAGTPQYMSPEQVRGGPLSPASDLYACGLILFELLTGRPPFETSAADGVRACMEAHLHMAPLRAESLRPDLPADLVEVVDACLRKEPSRRPQDAAVLRAALLPILDRLAAAHPGATRWRRPEPDA